MNKLIIVGNLTADPELRSTQSGKSVCNFTVAVNERRGEQQEAKFFRVAAWNNLAENIKHYLHKGSKVLVVGQVGCEAYKASDGSPRASLTVLANEVEFLNSRSESQDAQEQPKPHEPMPVETPDDLPF